MFKEFATEFKVWHFLAPTISCYTLINKQFSWKFLACTYTSLFFDGKRGMIRIGAWDILGYIRFINCKLLSYFLSELRSSRPASMWNITDEPSLAKQNTSLARSAGALNHSDKDEAQYSARGNPS